MKTAIRKQVLAKRDRLTGEQRAGKSRKIEELLFALPEFQATHTILFFASFRSEVDTLPMIRRALAEGKRVALPKVQGAELGLFEIKDPATDVASGAWGIPEPKDAFPVRITDIDVVVVPGAAFDAKGNRIGYGAGFYDKLLAGFRGTTVALAFEVQIVQDVPASTHDVPVKKIITEERIIAP